MTAPAPYYDRNGITIYCGDWRDVLSNLRYDVVVTDPPYGIALAGLMSGYPHEHTTIAGDEDAAERDALLAATAGTPVLMFGSPKVTRPAGVRRVLIWDKGEHAGMGDLAFPWKATHEEIYVLGTGWVGQRSGSVLRYHAVAGTVAIHRGRHHPTEKPVSLMQALLLKCPPAWVVLDPFAGSGSTLVAARNLGRRAIGVEIAEEYCAAAVRRLRQGVLPLVIEEVDG